jgi:hypothetical protein
MRLAAMRNNAIGVVRYRFMRVFYIKDGGIEKDKRGKGRRPFDKLRTGQEGEGRRKKGTILLRSSIFVLRADNQERPLTEDTEVTEKYKTSLTYNHYVEA